MARSHVWMVKRSKWWPIHITWYDESFYSVVSIVVGVLFFYVLRFIDHCFHAFVHPFKFYTNFRIIRSRESTRSQPNMVDYLLYVWYAVSPWVIEQLVVVVANFFFSVQRRFEVHNSQRYNLCDCIAHADFDFKPITLAQRILTSNFTPKDIVWSPRRLIPYPLCDVASGIQICSQYGYIFHFTENAPISCREWVSGCVCVAARTIPKSGL